MQIGPALALGAAQPGGIAARGSLIVEAALQEAALRLRLTELRGAVRAAPELQALTLDGGDVLGAVAARPQMAATPEPGTVRFSGTVVSALTGPLEVGARYLVSYEIIDKAEGARVFFSSGAGSPFSGPAPSEIGLNTVLVTAEDTDTAALMRVSDDVTFARVSCRKAEWVYALPPGSPGEEISDALLPGRVTIGGTIIAAPTGPLEIGTDYVLRYQVTANAGGGGLFVPSGGSPFDFTSLPATVGHHAVTLTAQDAETLVLARVAGADADITFGYFSCRKAQDSIGRRLAWEFRAGATPEAGALFTPEAGVIHVAQTGSDRTGTGALLSPLRQPAAARPAAGDTVILHPGVYAPFAVTASGMPGNPVTYTTPPGAERQAIIRGRLQDHVINGGPGEPQAEAPRGGIEIRARDHIHIRNLTVEDMAQDGIHITGRAGEVHGHHVIAGNRIRRTGNAGIWASGYVPSLMTDGFPPNGTVWTDDVLIEGNDVSQTNLLTDFNQTLFNSEGEPGGVNEAISVVGAIANVVTRFNAVHDSRQYGIDYKGGVLGGEIRGNTIWNIERYGIYLDAGRREVSNIAVHANRVHDCEIGITLAREASLDYAADAATGDLTQTLKTIDVYNNLFWNIEKIGIFCQKHPVRDGPDGEISDIRIRFNTVFNANRDAVSNEVSITGWADPAFRDAGIVSGIEFIGNLVWRNDRPTALQIRGLDDLAQFTVTDNLTDQNPLFVSETVTPPNLRLRPASPARGRVRAAFTASPFDRAIDGADRTAIRAAGAY